MHGRERITEKQKSPLPDKTEVGSFCAWMRSVLFDVDAGGGKGKIHAVSLHDVHDVQVQVVLHLQKLGVDVGQQVGRDQDVDAGISEAGQLHDVGAVVGEGACIQHGLQVLHQLFQLRAGGAVGDTQREFVGAHGAQGGVLHGGRADLAVGDHIDGFVRRADAGGAEVDVDHFAFHIAHGDPVAHREGFVQQDDDAAEQVAGAFLRRQRDGQADETGTGNDAADGEAHLLRTGGHAHCNDQYLVGGVQQGEQGLVGADLRAAGCQHQIGQLRSCIQALAHQQGHDQLECHQEQLAHTGNGPRQAGSGQIDAHHRAHALHRNRKAAQQDGRAGEMPAACLQGGEALVGQPAAHEPCRKQNEQSAYGPGSKGGPALQQHRAELKGKITDRENHTKPPVFLHNKIMITYLRDAGKRVERAGDTT